MRKAMAVGLAAWLSLVLIPGGTVVGQQPGQSFELRLPDWLMSLRLPNGAGKSLSSPSAFGGAFGAAFVGGGYQYPVPFDDVGDAVLAGGVGLWDPVQYVGVEASVAVIDVSELGEVTLGVKIHRYLGKGTAVAFGAENLYENLKGDDNRPLNLDPTFFGVVSHTFQTIPGWAPGTGRVHVSLGVGNGRFAEKPLRAQREGKGKDGTYVFGNAAVELARNFNAIMDWDGVGLNAGVGYTLPLSGVGAALTVGVGDITREASDRPRLLLGGGLGVRVFR